MKMIIGIGIVLIALGMMFVFLIPGATDVLDLPMIGWICLAIGIITVFIGIVIAVKNRDVVPADNHETT